MRFFAALLLSLVILAAPASADIGLRGTASANAINGSDVTVTMPVGTAQGDVVFAAYCQGGDNLGVDHNLVTTTAGYTELADLFSDDTIEAELGVYVKVMGASPDANVVFDVLGNSSTGAAGAVMVLTGVNTTTPTDQTTTTATGIDGPTPDPPSITTQTANAWVLAIGCSTEADVPTAPSSYSNLEEDIGTDTAPGVIMMARRLIASPGAENPGTFGGIAGGVGDSWAAATVAVKAAVVSGSASNMLMLGCCN